MSCVKLMLSAVALAALPAFAEDLTWYDGRQLPLEGRAWMTPSKKDLFCREIVRKLRAEDPKLWGNLYHLPCEEMYPDDGDPSVDGCHPNDWGMKFVAKGFEQYVREAVSQ